MPLLKKIRVFVSYSRHDEALVRPLAGLLGIAADRAVFLDVTSLQPGDQWETEIFTAVEEASVFVLCWCCEAQASEFVAREIAAALSDSNKRLVPVMLCSANLPPTLVDRQWIDLRGRVVHDCREIHGQPDIKPMPQEQPARIWRPREPLPDKEESELLGKMKRLRVDHEKAVAEYLKYIESKLWTVSLSYKDMERSRVISLDRRASLSFAMPRVKAYVARRKFADTLAARAQAYFESLGPR